MLIERFEHHGVTFLAPDNENGCKNQFVIVHKCIDALQEECTLFNRDVGRRLDHCESATHDLSGRLLGGLGDMNTKLSELTIDDMFVKTLQQGVESTRSNLEEFKKGVHVIPGKTLLLLYWEMWTLIIFVLMNL